MQGTIIPKKIHYIWLGKNRKPTNFDMVFQSWKTYAKGFEIKEWNEDSIAEFNLPPYYYSVYTRKKYAFASDVLRFYILKKYGGIYFDIDQVLIRDLDQNFESLFLNKRLFISKYHEIDTYYGFGFFGVVKESLFAKDMITYYQNYDFQLEQKDSVVNKIGSAYINEYLVNNLKKNSILVVSQDYFYPLTQNDFTKNTYSYHLANVSWQPYWKKILYKFKIYFLVKSYMQKVLPKQVLKKIGFRIDY